VTVARGIHFSVMGHSTPRPRSAAEPGVTHKRLELLPEEAIYLIERGALFCWKKTPVLDGNSPNMEDMQGAPMSVHQAYSEMIGVEDLTLEKYQARSTALLHFAFSSLMSSTQVFAYLKRLGYAVTRTDPPSPSYPRSAPFPKPKQERTMLQWLRSALRSWWLRVFRPLMPGFNWWRPFQFSSCLNHDKNYGEKIQITPILYLISAPAASVFKSLRFIPSGHDLPLYQSPSPSSPYRIFFNLYKPSTPFRKTAPPPPDFSVVVVE
jgi:tRNA-splicing endonuclease subunit Sen54